MPDATPRSYGTPEARRYGSWVANTSKKLDVSWGHEPVGIPLNRPPGTFSPTGGEGRDEGVRFMGSLDFLFRRRIGAMNPGVAASRQSAAIRGNNQPAALCRDATTRGRLM